MKKLDCYEYCELDSKSLSGKILFGYSEPKDDYFNDNLDQYFDEDDYYEYTDNPEEKFELEDKTFTHSHPAVH